MKTAYEIENRRVQELKNTLGNVRDREIELENEIKETQCFFIYKKSYIELLERTKKLEENFKIIEKKLEETNNINKEKRKLEMNSLINEERAKMSGILIRGDSMYCKEGSYSFEEIDL